MAAVCFVSCVAGKGCCAKKSAGAEANGVAAAEGSSSLAMRKLCAAADAGGVAKSLLLPGASSEQRAEVCMYDVHRSEVGGLCCDISVFFCGTAVLLYKRNGDLIHKYSREFERRK